MNFSIIKRNLNVKLNQYDDKILMENNYIYYLLKGYFGDKNIDKLKKVSDDIMRYYIKNCFNNIKTIEYKMNYMSQEEVENYELKMFEFYNFCIKILLSL